MTIRYKVVTGERRSLITVTIVPKRVVSPVCSFVRLYEKGSTVCADPRTMGLMVFKTHSKAVEWLQGVSFLDVHHPMILRVETHGREEEPDFILSDGSLYWWEELLKEKGALVIDMNDSYLERYYKHMPVPSGTLLCRLLTVLE